MESSIINETTNDNWDNEVTEQTWDANYEIHIDFDHQEDKQKKKHYPHDNQITIYVEDLMKMTLKNTLDDKNSVDCIQYIKCVFLIASFIKNHFNNQTNKNNQLKRMEIHNTLQYVYGHPIIKDHRNIYGIMPYLKWIMDATKYLSFLIKQDFMIQYQTTPFITRHSYQFCPHGGNCNDFYLFDNQSSTVHSDRGSHPIAGVNRDCDRGSHPITGVNRDCEYHHYIHALLHNDISSLYQFLMKKNEQEAVKYNTQFTEFENKYDDMVHKIKSVDLQYDDFHYSDHYYKNNSYGGDRFIFTDSELEEIKRSIDTIHYVAEHMSLEIILYENILIKTNINKTSSHDINKYHRNNIQKHVSAEVI